jgi:hypothetical protein
LRTGKDSDRKKRLAVTLQEAVNSGGIKLIQPSSINRKEYKSARQI